MRHASELEARITRELEQILEAVTDLTELHSNWTGRVTLVPDADFKGHKPFSCDICLDQAVADRDRRWSTLIHEALHAVSTGYVGTDYRSHPGWEEGVVEGLQRMLRPSILARIGVGVEEAVFQQSDEAHIYNPYLEALERLRAFLGLAEEQFYIDLLRTPIRERPGSIYEAGRHLPAPRWKAFVGIYSRANSVLNGVRRF